MTFAEVAVDAPAGYDRTFSYSVPPALDAHPGHLVRVPFGRRTLQGVVFSLAAVPQVTETRDIIGVVGSVPVLDDGQLALARWLSSYYMCPLFEAAALMLPPGGRARPRTYLSLADPDSTGDNLRLTAPQRRVVEYLRRKGTAEEGAIARALGPGVSNSVVSLASRGVLARSDAPAPRRVTPKVRRDARLTAAGRCQIEGWLAIAERRAPTQAAIVASLREDGATLPLAQLRKEYGASSVNALIARGWIDTEAVPVERDPLEGMSFTEPSPVTLTSRQAAIAAEVAAVLEDAAAAPRTFLIQGVTGSGKTEIYFAAVDRCLRLGKKAIVLAPEIALAHQTVQRFGARFAGQVAVLHSGLSAGERHDQWWKVKQGDYGVVIGSRGAVFAPQPDLGLIVLDEEHEWTYKQHDASPRYHARDVALKLSEMTGAVVVLGSASPDVASYHAGLRGRFRLRVLPHRFSHASNGSSPGSRGAPLASVEVVDMRRELREGNRDIFSRALASAMDECIASGDQMMMLLNRRGSASHVQCRACGLSLRCRRCDVSLTYHRGAARVVCHYCGYRRTPPAKCPRCLSYGLSFYGIGTEAVVDQLARRFPDKGVLRWDRDAARGARAGEELLERFRSGDAQILVGTQMIAKGLHFPSVTLVGVVSADTGLNAPDYRAGERAFQLLCQVAGRAGRGPSPGKVVIQTYQPEAYAVQAGASQDYQRFYRQEMAFRREQSNPPYARLIRLLYAHTNAAHCQREAFRLAGLIREQKEAQEYSEVGLLGPAPAYPARVRGRYRWQLILRGLRPRALIDRVPIPTGWVVDVDPALLA